MTTSDLIRSRIAILLNMVQQPMREIWDRPDPVGTYCDYLVRLHYSIRASVPLMERAAERAEEMSGDAVAGPLARYLRRHIPEETGHDGWIIEDLSVIQPAIVSRLSRMPDPPVAEMIGAQYYWALHHHPVSVLGYIMVAEGNPPLMEWIDEIRGRTGLPKEAFRTLYRHARIDLHHRKELFELVDALPCSAEQVTAMSTAATHATTSYLRFWRELARQRDVSGSPRVSAAG